MTRTLKDYSLLILKGMSMGAADVVPGVSGGTIAFILGIYDELINSIKSINKASITLFLSGKWHKAWKAINGNFLVAIATGIFISVLSLVRLITWLLENQPILVWSFFFGLVLASTLFVGKSIKEWNWKSILGGLAGACLAFYITIASPAETPTNLFFIFLSGSIAVCAMILPGISGSFILVLLGKYFYIMDAVKRMDIVTLACFGIGAAVGIATFSRLLSYALTHVRNITLATLTGFMLGSLNKVWPWKETIETYVDRHGVARPLVEQNILPNTQVCEAVILMLFGFFAVFFLEKLSSKSN